MNNEIRSASVIETVNPWMIHQARIVRRHQEAEGIITLDIELVDEAVRAAYQFRPGQFNMLYVFGVGECAISISSSAHEPAVLSHTIHVVGQVTNAIARLGVGDMIGVRGPYGSHWPIERAHRKNLTLVAGGIGLPPLRPVIYEIMRDRDRFDRVTLVYGAKTPSGLLFTEQFQQWQDEGIEMLVTVDSADESWHGYQGMVPMIVDKIRMRGANNIVMMCGPEIMMKFVAKSCVAREVPPDQVILTMERNMKCAIGHCGHCQLLGDFLCKDGPVLTYDRVKTYLNREGF